MSKFWTLKRVKRERHNVERREQRAYERFLVERERERTYSKGDIRKNIRLALSALGLPLRRKMISRLKKAPEMSLTTLADPFNITLPTAFFHLQILRRAGLVTTYKHGRVLFCAYRVGSLDELGRNLEREAAFLE